MRKFKIFFGIFAVVAMFMVSCNKNEEVTPDQIVYGEVTVDLDVNKSYIRTQEAPVGNFVCDAMADYVRSEGHEIDFAVFNAGGIRFDAETRPDGIYLAGDFTEADANEMFPFGNTITVVEVTGEELKSIFEHSVSLISQAEGVFLQVSSEVEVQVDTTMQVEIIDETDPDNPSIVTYGQRITSLKIGGTDFDSLATYKLATSNYIAEGNDTYVTFGSIASDKKTSLDSLCQVSLKYYLEKKGSVTPKTENRISIQYKYLPYF